MVAVRGDLAPALGHLIVSLNIGGHRQVGGVVGLLLWLACNGGDGPRPSTDAPADTADTDELVDEDTGVGADDWDPDEDKDQDGVPALDDCDDEDPSRAPGLPELWNGADDDCDWLIDEAVEWTTADVVIQVPGGLGDAYNGYPRPLDWNGDGAVDLLFGADVQVSDTHDQVGGMIVESVANAEGTWAAAATPAVTLLPTAELSFPSTTVGVLDSDGDGFSDLLFYGDDRLWLLNGADSVGSAVSLTSATLGPSEARFSDAGFDVNNDGFEDALGFWYGSTFFMHGQPDGTLAKAPEDLDLEGEGGRYVGDLDADGVPDFATGEWIQDTRSTYTIEVFSAAGRTASLEALDGEWPGEVGDLNGDGYDELLLGMGRAGANNDLAWGVRFGQAELGGSWGQEPDAAIAAYEYLQSDGSADLDQDGKAELMFQRSRSSTCIVFGSDVSEGGYLWHDENSQHCITLAADAHGTTLFGTEAGPVVASGSRTALETGAALLYRFDE